MYIQKSFKDDRAENFYVLPTPIGNLEDITIRVVNILKTLDILYCEDTRVTKKLLKYLDINIPLRTYNDFSFEKEKDNILNLIEEDKKVGLVSDAGMPGISDPGFNIIKYLKEMNKKVIILPGPIAFALPMVYLSKNEKSFRFFGFLSKKNTTYKSEIEEILSKNDNAIVYESPHRIQKTLTLIQKLAPKTNILLARELTKIYEEYIQGDVSEVISHIDEYGIKGEIVLIITPVKEEKEVDYLNEVNKLIVNGISKKDAVKEVASTYGISKNKLYDEVIKRGK